MIFYKKTTQGFTLIELLVTISLIALLSSIIYASFDDARKQSRDKIRKADLKELQLAVELYKAQNNRYPEQGCGVGSQFAGLGPVSAMDLAECTVAPKVYIKGLVPDFIPKLPRDPKSEDEVDKGFYYRTDALGTKYKIIVFDSVETDTVGAYDNEFARCPGVMGTYCAATAPANTYAVYSAGAEDW